MSAIGNLLGWIGGREQRSMESPTVSLSGSSEEELLAFFGLRDPAVSMPAVTVESALEVPAVFAAVMFLSRSMAALPLHAYRNTDGEPARIGGDLAMLLNEAPNPEWTSFAWRQHMWQQVFTTGRGMSWIERIGDRAVAIWPMDPSRTTVHRMRGRKVYRTDGKEYPAADVIDVVFALKPDGLAAYSPVWKGRKAIALAIAMGDFASTFFAGGGIPPMSLEGPLPSGADAFRRAMEQINRAIDLARKSGRGFFPMPPGHTLKAVGIDPEKGQMTEARLFQLQEIARVWQLPPVFLQDLSKGTFANTEQQDLQLVKHLIGQWARAFEDELNLKLFGQRRRARRVKHNLDGLMRGDFKSRIEAMARGIQTAQLTPDEARALEERPPIPHGHIGYIQGATVPLGTVPGAMIGHNGGPALEDGAGDDDADTNNAGDDADSKGAEDDPGDKPAGG